MLSTSFQESSERCSPATAGGCAVVREGEDSMDDVVASGEQVRADPPADHGRCTAVTGPSEGLNRFPSRGLDGCEEVALGDTLAMSPAGVSDRPGIVLYHDPRRVSGRRPSLPLEDRRRGDPATPGLPGVGDLWPPTETGGEGEPMGKVESGDFAGLLASWARITVRSGSGWGLEALRRRACRCCSGLRLPGGDGLASWAASMLWEDGDRCRALLMRIMSGWMSL